MLNYYGNVSDWRLEACDKPLNADAECPGQGIKLTCPEALERMQALERMLKENGYNVEK